MLFRSNSMDPRMPCTLVPNESPALQMPIPNRANPRLSMQGAAPRSAHPMGVHIALADGSVRYLAETVNADVWLKTLTIKNGDPFDDKEF